MNTLDTKPGTSASTPPGNGPAPHQGLARHSTMLRFLGGLPDPRIRAGLGWSVVDGMMWAIMFSLGDSYMNAFLIFFGAGALELAAFQGLSQLATGGGQALGSLMADRMPERKQLAFLSVSIQAVVWVVIFLGTWITSSPWVGLILYCIGVLAGNLASPAWNSWMNDLIPTSRRGLYWASRNRIIGVVQVLAFLAAGWALEWARLGSFELWTWALLFGLAFLSRLSCLFALGRQYEPPRHEASAPVSLKEVLESTRASGFLPFVLFSIGLNAATTMIAPLIQIRLLKDLAFDYGTYTMVSMVATVATFVFMGFWGSFGDRFGNRRILRWTAFAMPLIPLGWAFLADPWSLAAVQVLTGFLYAGLNLATANYLFDAIPPRQVSKAFAFFSVLNMVAGFLGATLGGLLATFWAGTGWVWGPVNATTVVFFAAIILRFVVMGIWGRGFPEVRPTDKLPRFLQAIAGWNPLMAIRWLRRRGRKDQRP